MAAGEPAAALGVQENAKGGIVANQNAQPSDLLHSLP